VTTQTGPPKTVPEKSAVVPLEVPPLLMKMRMLIADDNHTNRIVALAQLHKLGYAAQAVVNGWEAVQALEQVPYDVILMDCQMPEMDGYEATRIIRKREQSSNRCSSLKLPVYIIAMTATAMQVDREKCLAVGMDDFISKPVRIPDLQAALERWKQRPARDCPVRRL
jgi:two-component system sensor histidine kinase/response regulator